ncbi:MAG: hypothetical protein JXA21_18840 [Anaerolineae bacterium]|nr:hypothetical protein [Anaerolineae bacterium]
MRRLRLPRQVLSARVHISIVRMICLVLLTGATLACETLLPSSGVRTTPTLIVVAPSATPRSRTTSTAEVSSPTTTLAGPSATPHVRKTPTPAIPTLAVDPKMQSRHQDIFQGVWDAVSENYVYSDYNGVDWVAAYADYAPQIDAAPDDATFWRIMQELIDSLGDDHSVFLSPEEVVEEDQAASGDLDYVGIGVYTTVPEGKTYGVVLFPLPGGPAQAAGILAHDRIWTIDGTPACCSSIGTDNLDLLRGEEGTLVEVTVQSPDQDARTVSLRRARIQTQVPVLWRRIPTGDGDVGYLFIPTLWDATISERTREILEKQLDGTLSGLIIDMRINGGGAYLELSDLLALFVKGDVGYFYSRGEQQDTLRIHADPIHNSMELPLVILVGRDTQSFAEVFSGVLQAAGRAALVGHPTAGNVETLYPYNFKDGSRLWLAEESFVPPDGTRWEGEGLQPDERVDAQWEDFTDATDPYIEVALRVLRTQTN